MFMIYGSEQSKKSLSPDKVYNLAGHEHKANKLTNPLVLTNDDE